MAIRSINRLQQRLSHRRGIRQFEEAMLRSEPHVRAELRAAAVRSSDRGGRTT